MEQQTKIKVIRAFFGLSVAAFDFARAIASLTDKAQAPSKMESLHRKALIEANKENPDLEFLDAVIFDMQKLEEGNIVKPNFKSGGVMHKTPNKGLGFDGVVELDGIDEYYGR